MPIEADASLITRARLSRGGGEQRRVARRCPSGQTGRARAFARTTRLKAEYGSHSQVDLRLSFITASKRGITGCSRRSTTLR